MSADVTYHVARGAVVRGNLVIYAENKGTTRARAENNMLKSMCNKMRSEVEIRAQWIKWKNLSSREQDEWLKEVRDNLSWTKTSCNESRMERISSSVFFETLGRGQA